MQFSGKYLFYADRLAVWNALNDVHVLKTAIPGCSNLQWSGSNTLDLTLSVNLGLMSPKFAGDLRLDDVDPTHSYTLYGKGRGGVLGLAEGGANILLEDSPVGTLMTMRATGAASSTIMSLGQKLVGRTAQGVIDRFFERFADAMDSRIEILDPPELELVQSDR
ncbi:carbon monoxide dehydrogenase subunit G [bacterium]|nr:carbon monoxide dehydrogenase subunit G [bacterium]